MNESCPDVQMSEKCLLLTTSQWASWVHYSKVRSLVSFWSPIPLLLQRPHYVVLTSFPHMNDLLWVFDQTPQSSLLYRRIDVANRNTENTFTFDRKREADDITAGPWETSGPRPRPIARFWAQGTDGFDGRLTPCCYCSSFPAERLLWPIHDLAM